MDASSIALASVLFLLAVMLFVLLVIEWSGDKTHVIDNVFNPNKYVEADTNLVIVENKPNKKTVFDKLYGKYNINKIQLFIKKDNKNFKLEIPSYEDYNFDGRGIVIAASGNRYRYVTGLYMNIYVIRKVFHSNIPIEVMYVGDSEKFNTKVYEKLKELENVKIIDLTTRLDTNVKENYLKGYRTKPLAVIASSFKEVILFDADALVFIDPYKLFETNGYIKHGMVLFKDYVECLNFINKKFIDNVGIGSKKYCNKTHGYEIDSSCVIVNKKKAWEALFTICIINIESDSYYGHPSNGNNVLGDKDTWLIGSIFVGFDPYIVNTDPGILVIDEEKRNPRSSKAVKAQPTDVSMVLGHVQFQNTKDFQIYTNEKVSVIPIYYNNQAIDLTQFDGMEEWGYVEGNIKNPYMFKQWNYNYKNLTPNMINAFNGAHDAINNIIDIIDIDKPNKNNRKYPMVVPGMI